MGAGLGCDFDGEGEVFGVSLLGAGSGFGGVVDSYRLVRKRGGAEDLEGARVGRRRKKEGEGLIARARARRAHSAGLLKWFVVCCSCGSRDV